jgi:hypothetical protein
MEQTTKAMQNGVMISSSDNEMDQRGVLCPFDGHVTMCELIYIGGGTPKI